MGLAAFNRRRRLNARKNAEAHPRQTEAITKQPRQQPKRNDKKRGASKATGKGDDAS